MLEENVLIYEFHKKYEFHPYCIYFFQNSLLFFLLTGLYLLYEIVLINDSCKRHLSKTTHDASSPCSNWLYANCFTWF